VPGSWSDQFEPSWMLLGGLEALTVVGTPYLEFRVHGFQRGRAQVVVGWRVVP
jgi:hypothetical protein